LIATAFSIAGKRRPVTVKRRHSSEFGGDTFVLGCARFEVAKQGLLETGHLRE
jgi:hypothetical protein